jgi:hypothetical protein
MAGVLEKFIPKIKATQRSKEHPITEIRETQKSQSSGKHQITEIRGFHCVSVLSIAQNPKSQRSGGFTV